MGRAAVEEGAGVTAASYCAQTGSTDKARWPGAAGSEDSSHGGSWLQGSRVLLGGAPTCTRCGRAQVGEVG